MGLFLSTAKALVARGGPQALFVGLVPRLAHQVPGEPGRGRNRAGFARGLMHPVKGLLGILQLTPTLSDVGLLLWLCAAGAIVCWYCIETCHRTLTKHCHKHRTLPAADSQETILS
jgi:hypothetical protein